MHHGEELAGDVNNGMEVALYMHHGEEGARGAQYWSEGGGGGRDGKTLEHSMAQSCCWEEVKAKNILFQ